jgi:hypothetical protein
LPVVEISMAKSLFPLFRSLLLVLPFSKRIRNSIAIVFLKLRDVKKNILLEDIPLKRLLIFKMVYSTTDTNSS